MAGDRFCTRGGAMDWLKLWSCSIGDGAAPPVVFCSWEYGDPDWKVCAPFMGP